MKKSFFKPVLAFAVIVFVCGILFGITGSLLGGNPFRAAANIKRITGDSGINIKFNISEPENIPNNNRYYYDDSYDAFGGSDIYDFFDDFGMEDGFGDFFSPYGGGYYPDTDSGKIY